VVGAERRRERDRGRVRAAAPERGHLGLSRDALEAGHEHDPAVVERLVDAPRPHLHDLGLPVHRVGDDAGLRAGEGDRLVAEVVDHHRRERARDPLAHRDEHVELAWVRRGGHPPRQVEQLVGRVPHRGEDADHAIALLTCGDETSCDPLQAVRVADRRAPELHHHRAALTGLGVGVDRRDGFVLGRGHCRRV
jgi:hypothetical protein